MGRLRIWILDGCLLMEEGSIYPRVIMKLMNINDYFIQLTYMNNLFFIRKTIFIINYFLLLLLLQN